MVLNIIPEATDAPPGTKPTLRALTSRVYDLENNRKSDLTQANATDKGLAASIEQLSKQLNALPEVVVSGNQQTGFGLSTGWTTYASALIPIPAGKTTVSILATAGAAAVDMTTNGLATVYGRILIWGVPSVEFAAAKDAGVTAVNNIVTMSFHREASTSVGGAIPVLLQLNPTNSAPYSVMPGNYASLSVMAQFSTPIS